MALAKKVYGVKQSCSARNLAVYGVFSHHPKAEKALRHNGFQLPEVYVNASAGKSSVFT